jgi:hypothetical protein
MADSGYLLDAKAVAAHIGRSPRRAAELMEKQMIPSFRQGGRRLAPLPAVEAYARRLEADPPKPGRRPAAASPQDDPTGGASEREDLEAQTRQQLEQAQEELGLLHPVLRLHYARKFRRLVHQAAAVALLVLAVAASAD